MSAVSARLSVCLLLFVTAKKHPKQDQHDLQTHNRYKNLAVLCPGNRHGSVLLTIVNVLRRAKCPLMVEKSLSLGNLTKLEPAVRCRPICEIA